MYAQYECQLMLSLSCAGVTRDSEMVVTVGRHNGDKCIFIHFHCECEYIWNNKPIISLIQHININTSSVLFTKTKTSKTLMDLN